MSKYRRPPNTSLFVRNIHNDTRAEDMRKLFGRYGPISDVYIPLDYYHRKPRGFAYVQFDDVRDAEDALRDLDGTILFGRELEMQFADGNRKTPDQMRTKGDKGRKGFFGGGEGYYRGRRKQSYSRSRSRSPRRRSHSRSPKRKHSKRRESHKPQKSQKSRSYSRSRSRSASKSPVNARQRSSSEKSRSPSPRYTRSYSRSRSESSSAKEDGQD
ncbi:serine/arginine-rich splicing factor 10-like [Rhopilema esculentum]|uniref:serine/arginine-rich splicing factor 10-like n=1 Tax=Rhopilema esculentum TaxID=499914 RepID=UPI0031E0D2C9